MDILIIDDQRCELLLMSRLVETVAGCTPHTFSDPTAALLEACDRTFDLVLVDFSMPVMDGISFVRRLRDLSQYRTTPILLVTVVEEEAVHRAAFEAGTTAVVRKPYNLVEFIETVE